MSSHAPEKIAYKTKVRLSTHQWIEATQGQMILHVGTPLFAPLSSAVGSAGYELAIELRR